MEHRICRQLGGAQHDVPGYIRWATAVVQVAGDKVAHQRYLIGLTSERTAQ